MFGEILGNFGDFIRKLCGLLNFLVNPGKLPLGTSNDAQEHSAKTHQLPIPPGAKGLTNYYEVFGNILNFISQSSGKEEFPAFFTDSNELKTTKMIIDKIVRENEELDLIIHVYPIENLFFPLKKYTVQLKNEANGTNDRAFPSIFIAKDLIGEYFFKTYKKEKFSDFFNFFVIPLKYSARPNILNISIFFLKLELLWMNF